MLHSKLMFISNDRNCFHGPMIEIVDSVNGQSKLKCSAFRLERACRNDQILESRLSICAVTNHINNIPESERAYCVSCDCIFNTSQKFQHTSHELKSPISTQLSRMPSFLLKPLADSQSHAQYFFSLDCLNQLYSIIYELNFTHVICIGCPRLHEFIQLQQTLKNQSMTSHLLDIDFRLKAFYNENEFSRFNMVNGYFFDQNKGEENLKKYLNSIHNRNSCLFFCDPPFGAPLKLIIQQIEKFNTSLLVHKLDKEGPSDNWTVPIFFVLPFFFINKLKKFSQISLLDYKITYEKHSRLDCDISCGESTQGRRRDTIVHLFTNLSPSVVRPPRSLVNYFRFCDRCQRYSHLSNVHCDKCDRCTTKNGDTYVHCDKCGYCRQPRKVHCDHCKRCVSINQCIHQRKRSLKNYK